MEIKLVYINDYYNNRIEQSHFCDFEEDKEINDKYIKDR